MPGLVYKPGPLFETYNMSKCKSAFKLKAIEVAQKKSKEAAAREFKVFQVSIRIVSFMVYR